MPGGVGVKEAAPGLGRSWETQAFPAPPSVNVKTAGDCRGPDEASASVMWREGLGSQARQT